MTQDEKLDLILEKIEELDKKTLYLFSNLEDIEQRVDAIYPNVGNYYKKIRETIETSHQSALNSFEVINKSVHDSHDMIGDYLSQIRKEIVEDLDSIRQSVWTIDSSMMKQY